MSLDATLVRRRLHAEAIRLRLARAACRLISGLAVSLFFLAIFLLADTRFHLGGLGRWLGFLLTAIPLITGIGMAIGSMLRKISMGRMARRIELSCPDARNVLINALQFDEEMESGSPLRQALFHEMQDPFPGVLWDDVFDLKMLRRVALIPGLLLLLLGGWAVSKPEAFANSAERIMLPESSIPPLTRTRILTLKPGDITIPQGGKVSLQTVLGGVIPAAVWVNYREQGGGWQRVRMEHSAERNDYIFSWPSVRQSLEYYIEAGDARSKTHAINIRPRTLIRSRAAEISPPAYTHFGKQTVENFTTLKNIIPGSRASITLEFNAPLKEFMAKESEKNLPFSRIDEKRWKIDCRILGSNPITISYTDQSGVADSEQLPIAVRTDEPPAITISDPPEGKALLADREGTLGIAFTAIDDFGLASIALYKSSNETTDATLVSNWSEADGLKSFGARITVPLAKFTGHDEERATFCLVAKDKNEITGPGITISRPIVVSLGNAKDFKENSRKESDRQRATLEELIRSQQTNLDQTLNSISQPETMEASIPKLIERQGKITETNQHLLADEGLSEAIRSDLGSLARKEMKETLSTLNDATTAPPEQKGRDLSKAATLETAILARLKGILDAVADAGARKEIQDLIAGVEELVHAQRALLEETTKAKAEESKGLSERQDSLGEQTVRVRGKLTESSGNAAVGDQDFRTKLAKAARMFGDLRIYEQMLSAAEMLQAPDFTKAAELQHHITDALGRIVEQLNHWQFNQAAKKADELKSLAAEMKGKLENLESLQHTVVEKSKELARKDQFRPEDEATAREIQKTKEAIAEEIEKMLTDAHVFPEMNPSNELRSELTQIYEDVAQTDKEAIAEGKLKPSEIAVQKEDSILKEIEQAKKISADMEMWLPNKSNTTQWLLENFDKTEMPPIPNLPLPDAFEDIVGKLQDDQQSIADQVQDAASNQAFAQNNANGWEIGDGPMPGFGAQGKSGNQRPKKNEQTGRSSGGREGMSDGEMVGDRVGNLEGTKPDARRTSDPMQQGHVKDDGSIGETRATGGGKAGGFSDRNGMDGNAPLRPTKTPVMAANDALAVKQALLAEKTSKQYAQASLLYLRTGSMDEVTRLMGESRIALREGKTKEFQNIHQRIMAGLSEIRGGIRGEAPLLLSTGNGSRPTEKQLRGGDEGMAPQRYQKQVGDYYRSLNGETP